MTLVRPFSVLASVLATLATAEEAQAPACQSFTAIGNIADSTLYMNDWKAIWGVASTYCKSLGYGASNLVSIESPQDSKLKNLLKNIGKTGEAYRPLTCTLRLLKRGFGDRVFRNWSSRIGRTSRPQKARLAVAPASARLAFKCVDAEGHHWEARLERKENLFVCESVKPDEGEVNDI